MTVDLPLLWGELGVLLSCVAGVVLHEAGHAVAGHWAGLPTRLIRIGTGPNLARWRVGRLVVSVHAWPMSGFAAGPPLPGAKARAYAIRIAGGPAVNAVLCGLAAAAIAWQPEWEDALTPVVLTQGPMALLNLVPFSIRRYGQGRQSDGMGLLRCAQGKYTNVFETLYKASVTPVYPPSLDLPPPSADAPELLFQCHRPDRWFDKWARNDAQNEVERLLAADVLTVPEQALALNFLITNELGFNDTGSDDLWLRYWSSRAMLLTPEGVPQAAFVLLTHAGMLARVGEGARAEAILRRLDGKLKLPASLVCSRLYMAQAMAQQGRRSEVAAWLAQAREAATGPMRKALLKQIRRAERRPPLTPGPATAPADAPVDPGPDTAITGP